MPGHVYHREVTIIGGTFSGNKGAAGMLEAAIGSLGERLPEPALYNVLSIYPKADRGKTLADDVNLIGVTPPVLVFVLPPLALLYGVLKRLHLPRKFMLKFKPLKAIARADLVLDVSGISYADDRGLTLLYNLACNLPALFAGTPQIKLSQALGPFRTPLNRLAARLVLPRISRIFARGAQTARFLEEAGLNNWEEADDLAFLLGDAREVRLQSFSSLSFLDEPGIRIVGISPSQVVDNYMRAGGRSLTEQLVPVLTDLLTDPCVRVVILAHSMLAPEKKSKNNDYHIAVELGAAMGSNPRVSVVLDDLSAVELRAVIGRCEAFIACRFHSMVSALCAGTPVIVVGWSHKYHEVMGRFGLERYVIDHTTLNPGGLSGMVHRLLHEKDTIRASILEALPSVVNSAGRNIDFAAERLACPGISAGTGKTASRLYRKFFEGSWKGAWLGYSARPDIREGAASGGAVSSLLISMIESGRIQGAIVARSVVKDGSLGFETFPATTERDILSSMTSIYSDFNHTSEMIGLVRQSTGKLAVVGLPCQISALESFLENNPDHREKVFCKVALWCGHATERKLIDDFLAIKGIDLNKAEKLFYRRGLWRGRTEVLMKTGETVSFPFSSGYGLYQNLYVDCCRRCLSCPDHFGSRSDISFGDAWLSELKKGRIKYSMALAHTDKGKDLMNEAKGGSMLKLFDCDLLLPLKAQKRAVIWHTHNAAARSAIAPLFGLRLAGIPGLKPRIRDYPAAFIILLFVRWSGSRMRPLLFRTPGPLLKLVMLVQKFFLNS